MDQPPPSWTPPPPPPPPYSAYGAPLPWTQPHGPAPAPIRPRANRGVVGAALAGVLGFLKYGVALLKFGKFGVTLVTMVASALIYTALFGPAFGIGILLLILVHEMGHMLFAVYEGLPVSAPIFLGPFGAVINMRRRPVDARQEAVIAIGGPVVGTAASLLLYVMATSMDASYLRNLLFALAEFGCFINLFNLIPLVPLDGGRVASALSPMVNVAGIILLGAYFFFTLSSGSPVSPILPLILIVGVISTVRRFRSRNSTYTQIPGTTRLAIGIGYLLVIAVALLGHQAAHDALVPIAGTNSF